ncbi:MAG: acyltransferase family protein [Lachnospiraceae bacterium]|nr:acyltransferase family protein [Lachnospiraceae bacterium]
MGGRNRKLDVYKALAAIGVILVHIRFPGVVGSVFCSIGVCGVIFFFLISGYAIYGDNANDAVTKKLWVRFKRNAGITCIAVGIYFVFTVLTQICYGNVSDWMREFFKPVILLRMVFLGDFEMIYGDPLWFLPALCYSYLLFILIYKLKLLRVAHAMMPVFLLLRIGMETYTNSFGADWHMSGNAIVGALPIMLLGHFIAANRKTVAGFDYKIVVIFSLIAAAATFLSVNIKAGALDVSQPFKIAFASLVFIIAIRGYTGRDSVCKLLEYLGMRCSLYIYLFHYLIIVVLVFLAEELNLSDFLFDWFVPVAVIIVSVVVSVGIDRVKMLIIQLSDETRESAG